MNSIPKTFHAIWLGDKPMPCASIENLQRWQDLHPDWKVNIWGDGDAMPWLMEKGEWQLRSIMVKFESMAARSDILRLLILKHEGGVYIDGDMEPLRPIGPLVEMAEVGGGCFVGWEQNLSRINNAIIGASVKHPAIMDALDSLPAHLVDPATNVKDAAHATGPFYLNSIWRDDSRVVKFPRETFYPYDWHEPWKAGELFSQGTFAVHRWDASWIDEIQPAPHALKVPLGIVKVGISGIGDEARAALAAASHAAQSIDEFSRNYGGVWLGGDSSIEDLKRMVMRLRKCQRVFFVPWNHVLDRNTMHAHALLPRDAVGVTRSRMFSSKKLFPLNHRRANAFPFEIFAAHGFDMERPITGTVADVGEVFSIQRESLLKMLDSESCFQIFRRAGWRYLAAGIVKAAIENHGLRIAFTYKTRTTVLCDHPVLEESA